MFGCSSGTVGKSTTEMGAYYKVHKDLEINVLSFKVLQDNSLMPRLAMPKPGLKYVVVNFLTKNPGTNRGMPSYNFSSMNDLITLSHASLDKKKDIEDNFFAGLPEQLARAGDATTESNGTFTIAPLETKSHWAVFDVPANLHPPYLFKIDVDSSKQKGRPIIVELKN